MLKTVLSRSIHQGDFAGVWPMNRPAVDAFLAVASQWRTGLAVAEGRLRTLWVGLDYAAARAALALHAIAVTPEQFAGLQVMELEARNALNGENA